MSIVESYIALKQHVKGKFDLKFTSTPIQTKQKTILLEQVEKKNKKYDVVVAYNLEKLV